MTVFAFVLKSAIFGVLLYLWIKEIPLKWLLWVQLWIRLNIGLQMVDQSVIQNWHLWCKCYPHRPKSEAGRDNHHSNSSQDWSRIHRAHSSIGYTYGFESVLDPRKKEVFWNSFKLQSWIFNNFESGRARFKYSVRLTSTYYLNW